jgi:hypothetical protein
LFLTSKGIVRRPKHYTMVSSTILIIGQKYMRYVI